MASELKGRFATYYRGDKATGTVETSTRLSLNAVKMSFGADIARAVLAAKKFNLGNSHWFELELLPGEKTADETKQAAEETRRANVIRELVTALYLDLRESYPSVTRAGLETEAGRLLAGGTPTGGPSMFLKGYLEKVGLLNEER